MLKFMHINNNNGNNLIIYPYQQFLLVNKYFNLDNHKIKILKFC